jgi:hypothetical protein
MNHTEAIARATTLFQSIPVEYFNNSNALISSKNDFLKFEIIDNQFLKNFSVTADFFSTLCTYHLKNDDDDTNWNMVNNYYKIAEMGKSSEVKLFFDLT